MGRSPGWIAATRLAGPDPGRVPAPGIEREDGETARRNRRAGTEPRDSRANNRNFREVIPGARRGRALLIMHSQVNRGHYDALRTHPGHVGGELHPGVMPSHVDQFGVAVYLGVPGTSGGRAVGLLVIVPGSDRDPQRHASRYPARMDELREVLAGQIGAERVRRGRRARTARTLEDADGWQNSVLLRGDAVSTVARLKAQPVGERDDQAAELVRSLDDGASSASTRRPRECRRVGPPRTSLS